MAALQRQFGGRWLAWARALFGPLALLFLFAAAFASREAFSQIWSETDKTSLVLLISAWASLHLLVPGFGKLVLDDLGYNIRYSRLLRIHVSCLPSRYLPGGIWHTVSRMVALRDQGVQPSSLATLVFLENTVPLAVALLIGGALAQLGGLAAPGWAIALLGLSVLAAVLLALKRRTFGLVPMTDHNRMFLAVMVFALFWLLAGSLFAAYWQMLPAAAISPGLVQTTAIYLLSWSAGFVTVFAPQGIGVFESVASLMLRGGTSFVSMAVLVAGFRAITLAADGLSWMLLLAFDSLLRGRPTR